MSGEDKEVPIEIKNLDLKIRFEQMDLRLKAMENENKLLRERFNGGQNKLNLERREAQEKIDEYTKQIKDLETERDELTQDKKNLQQEKIDAEIKHQEIFNNYKKDQARLVKEKDEEIKDLKEREDFAKNIDEKWKKLKQEKEDLIQERDDEKKLRSQEVNEKERQKIQATESLRKEMLYKIKETKANLLALNDEQLQTTTRLTILQNHQLTTELEYQSKQTEQLLYKNNKMQAQITTLKRDIQIHKEVEKELAKRSHFCQKVIKRLKQQVKDLENEKVNGPSSRNNAKQKFATQDTSKQNEDLVNFLEHKLDEIEKKLVRTQNEYELLQGDYVELQDKVNVSREKYKRAALLMTEFLDDILNQTPNILESDKDMHLNLEKIKDTPIENLDKEDKVALVLVLLKQLQPYLSAQNLSTAPLEGHKQSGQHTTGPNSPMSQEQYIRNKTDEMLRQHGANGTHAEVDALNSILNNINVQTKNNQGGQMLPPI